MNESDFGGTKLPPRNKQMGGSPQMPQMQPQYQEPPQQMQMQMPQYQEPMYEEPYYQPQQFNQPQVQIKPRSSKSFFKSTFGDGGNVKDSMLVFLIFIILNSKIIWKQISRLPFMGAIEPSIISLVVNSILAAILFYFIKMYLK